MKLETLLVVEPVWAGTAIVPAYVATLSAVILAGHVSWRIVRSVRLKDASSRVFTNDSDVSPTESTKASQAVAVDVSGGLYPTGLNLLRCVCCFALLCLQMRTFVVALRTSSGHEIPWIQAALCATFAYVSVLAAVAFSASAPRRRVATRHLATVLAATWIVSTYRNVWPLATYTLSPADGAEGWLLWLKYAFLTVAGVVVPLVIPREYRPYDPKSPSLTPHPEQTASILSRMLFSYMTPVVREAARSPHLSLESLPHLADSDEMKNLVHRAFGYIDPLSPKAKGHIFWCLIRVFFWEHVELVILLVLLVTASFLAPIGINRLLRYLETGGDDSHIRPWFWCLWLFLGPFCSCVITTRYMYIALRVLARVQGLLTELIFEHSLRIRATSRTAESEASAQPSTDTASVADSSTIAMEQDESATEGDNQNTTTSPTPTPGGKTNDKDAKKDSNITGKINNLVTADVTALEAGQAFLLNLVYAPSQIIFSIVFLYVIVGWSVFVGFGIMVVLTGVPGLIGKMMHNTQVARMKASDARVESVTETIGGAIRMIKLFGWEDKINKRIDTKRAEELRLLRKQRLLILLNVLATTFIPVITMVATFATYTLVMKQELTPSRIFPCMSVFNLIRFHFLGFSSSVPLIINGKVALDRINEFLQKTELLDAFNNKQTPQSNLLTSIDDARIGFRAASFTWGEESDKTLSHHRRFRLVIENEVLFKQGQINLIVGQTGCGKTSMLMALLGEMHYTPLDSSSFFSLPRDKGVAYHAQDSWVLNETIKNNILFGSSFDSERYAKVIKQCALERDLSLFDAGDQTEVGEKGVTLSGGQKARVTLARAIYSSADILLLDDVFAALDVHTAQHIVDQCLRGDLVRGRTVILVTHNLAITAPVADFVVALTPDGRIRSAGSLVVALAADAKLSAEAEKDEQMVHKAEGNTEDDATAAKGAAQEQSSAGKLIVKEEIAEGRVSWSALKLLLGNTASSGLGVLLFWMTLLLVMLASRLATVLETWVLALWARQYEQSNPPPATTLHYMYLFFGVVVTSSTLVSLGYSMYILGVIRAVRVVHQLLINSVLHATLRWLDTTPASRITTRCTQDIASIDGPMLIYLHSLLDCFFDCLTKFIGVIVLSPVFAIPGAILGMLGGWIGNMYIRAQLSVKREMSSAKAPLLGHVGAAISGLVSIRAYGAQQAFILESYKRIDRYTLTARTFWNLSRWLSIRMETLSGLFSAGLAAYLVYSERKDAASTGFSLTMAVGCSTMILYLVRILNEVEINANSLERVQQYLVIDQEPKATESGVPPAYWPASGDLRVENLSAKYSADGPNVLHDISFHVKSGERVGIVGRTGSGKSSLTLALLRCIQTTGKVFFDGLPTDEINLDALRTSVTIIPQVPDLLSGTLRENIDPFEQYDDAIIHDALRSAGLYALQDADRSEQADDADGSDGKLTLDSRIASSGGNLSVGQRQIIALARAIVRQSRVLILDEATSAIDYETDAIIQSSLRNEVAKDVTLLTVAHRLHTIMDYDKIMVLDAGKIAEFGPPAELLKNKTGFFTTLVDASGDKATLYDLASKGREPK